MSATHGKEEVEVLLLRLEAKPQENGTD